MPFICKKINKTIHWTNSHSQIIANRHKQLPKNSCHKYTNATAFSNAAIRFIRPADKTVRTANPMWYFANRTWHACDVTSNQRPSSHVSSHITSSPVRSSQFANYQCPEQPTGMKFCTMVGHVNFGLSMHFYSCVRRSIRDTWTCRQTDGKQSVTRPSVQRAA